MLVLSLFQKHLIYLYCLFPNQQRIMYYLMICSNYQKHVLLDFLFQYLILQHENSLPQYDEYDELFRKHVENWDMDRLAFLDRIIIKMGITELLYCPNIPVRVTMNEYIELAKEFSTERSKLFVNGLLDRFLIDLRAEGRIMKEDIENE